MNEIKTFEINKTYTFRFIGNADLSATAKILKRTAKFVTIKTYGEDPVRCGIHVYDGSERCYPLGKYSMCPVLRADRIA